MLKRIPLSIRLAGASVLLACLASPAMAQEPTRQLIYSLHQGESILREESIIAVTADAVDVILVLSVTEGTADPFFVFRDGKRTGPYPKLEEAMKVAYEGRKSSSRKRRDCAKYNPGEPPEDARPYSDSTEEGKQIVRFKEKTFGPFVLVFSSQATPDGTLAYYTAADNDKAWFGCSDGRTVSFGGLPIEFKFSPDGKNAAVLCQGKLSLAEKDNLSNLPPEKLAAALKEEEKKYLYTIDGKRFGPFESGFGEGYGSFWYASSTNDLYYYVNNQLYRNGTPMLKTDSLDPCNFYPSPDGKKYAMFTYESIVFSDGKTYPSPLDIVVFQHEGKTVFKWITLENDKDLVVCQRAM
jgi:hypothetical protein